MDPQGHSENTTQIPLVTDPSFVDDKFSQQNITSRLRRNNTGTRPDWLLYTVPGLAFVVGIILFLFVFKRHNKKTGGYHQRVMKGCSSVRQTGNMNVCIPSDDMGPASLTKADTQSYENVLAAIYTNQEQVCFYVPADDEGGDYITPDGENDATESPDFLNLPATLTEGESYENMEGLYAQPSKRHNKGQIEDEDYVDPYAEEKHCQGELLVPQEQTDTDSYENMEQQFAAHQRDSNDYITPDIDEGHCYRLMSCPQNSAEDTYVTMEDGVGRQEWQ